MVVNIRLGWKKLAVTKTNTLAYNYGKVFTTLFLQLMIGTNKLIRSYYSSLERLSRDEHSSLLSQYVSYKENEVLLIQFLPYQVLYYRPWDGAIWVNAS